MGHIRLRTLPKSRKWQQVVEELRLFADVSTVTAFAADAAEVSPQGASSERGTQAERAAQAGLGRSRGGFGIRSCVIADGSGRAVALRIAPGQAHELPHAVPRSTACRECRWIVADRG